MVDEYDPQTCTRVFSTFVRNGTRYVPTHLTRKMDAFADNTAFCCWLIDQPLSVPEAVRKLRVKEKAINFYAIVPLYEQEMMLKLREGSGALARGLDRAQVTELINLARPVAVG